jgi:hypothetical protein
MRPRNRKGGGQRLAVDPDFHVHVDTLEAEQHGLAGHIAETTCAVPADAACHIAGIRLRRRIWVKWMRLARRSDRPVVRTLTRRQSWSSSQSLRARLVARRNIHPSLSTPVRRSPVTSIDSSRACCDISLISWTIGSTTTRAACCSVCKEGPEKYSPRFGDMPHQRHGGRADPGAVRNREDPAAEQLPAAGLPRYLRTRFPSLANRSCSRNVLLACSQLYRAHLGRCHK